MNKFKFTCPMCDTLQTMFTFYGGKDNETYEFPDTPTDILQELVDNGIDCVNCNSNLTLDKAQALIGKYELIYE